jgi:hypothetical protein
MLLELLVETKIISLITKVKLAHISKFVLIALLRLLGLFSCIGNLVLMCRHQTTQQIDEGATLEHLDNIRKPAKTVMQLQVFELFCRGHLSWNVRT